MDIKQKIYVEDLYKKLAKLLKTAVHTKGCEDVDSCPNGCYCRKKARPKKLDLHTAILWTAASYIENDVSSIWKNQNKYKKGLALLIFYLENFLDVISYHSMQYPKEEDLLETILDCLDTVYDFLDGFIFFDEAQEKIEYSLERFESTAPRYADGNDYTRKRILRRFTKC